MERVCSDMIPGDVLRPLQENKAGRFDYVIELLRERRPDLADQLPEIRLMHSFYGCLLNGKTMAVSQDLCLRARSLLERLEEPQPTEEEPREERLPQ